MSDYNIHKSGAKLGNFCQLQHLNKFTQKKVEIA